jgi:hypothetical protein
MPQVSEKDKLQFRDAEALADDSVNAISTMLSDLKSAAMDTLDPPLLYNNVLLTWPDFVSEYMYKDRFLLATYLAGLDQFRGRGNSVSNSVIRYEGVDVACYEEGRRPMEDECCDPSMPNLPVVLVVSYNAASLGVTLNTRPDGDLTMPARLAESPTLGASKGLSAHATSMVESAKYWREVRECIASVIGNSTIDYLILLGSNAQDPNLLQAIKNVIDSRDDIDLSILDRYTAPLSSGDDQNRELFTAARQTAIEARFGMKTGFHACIDPLWCGEQSEL